MNAYEIALSPTSSDELDDMSQAKDSHTAGYGQIKLHEDNDPLNLEAAPPRRTSDPGIVRRTGILFAYLALCAGAFLVVGHYKSSYGGSHLPPVRDLRIPQPSSRLRLEDLIYEDDPLSLFVTKSSNCTTPREEQWAFVDADCGHGFTRGTERFQSSASANFTLPVGDKEGIQLSNRGNARMSGVAHITQAEDITQSDVQVEVTVYMHDREVFERTVKVCRSTGPLALFGDRFSFQAVGTGHFVGAPAHY